MQRLNCGQNIKLIFNILIQGSIATSTTAGDSGTRSKWDRFRAPLQLILPPKKLFACDICGESREPFRDSYNLDRHVREAHGNHFTYEPLVCGRYLGSEKFCNQEFTSSHELKLHRAGCFWACDVSGCEIKGATRKKDIDRHARKHAAEKEKHNRFSHLLPEP